MARVVTGASSQYIQTASFPNASVPLSIACWIRPDSTSGYQRALTWSASGSGQVAASVLLNYPSAGNVSTQAYSGGVNSLPSGTGTFSTGSWHHVVCVTEARAARCYLNGASAGEGTWGSDISFSGCTYLSVGRADTVTSQYYYGRIAFAAAWSAVLTQADVDALYAGLRHPRMVRPGSLIGAWDFGGFAGENDRDNVGGYHLTAYNSPTWADSRPLWYPNGPISVISAAPSAPAATPWLYAVGRSRVIGGGVM